MTRVFISQPMRDKSNEEIKLERERCIEFVKKEVGEDIEIIDSFFENAPHDTRPLWYLSKSLELLSTADVAVFCGDWHKYRGCQIENLCCERYDIRKMYFESVL